VSHGLAHHFRNWVCGSEQTNAAANEWVTHSTTHRRS